MSAFAASARGRDSLALEAIPPPGMNDGLIAPGALPADAPLLQPGLMFSPRVPSPPMVGQRRALALLVDFKDNQGTADPAHFRRLLFDASNPNSLRNYYKDLSYGLLDVDGEVTEWLRMPKPYTFYTNGQSGGGAYPRNTQGLLEAALALFCKTDSLARFDRSGDGALDGVFLVHAGSGAEAEKNPEAAKHMIWSHKWVLPNKFVNNGVQVYAYSVEPEDGRLGVFAHEFGHCLGLPDLYDRSGYSFGVGDWCLMAAGSWGNGGNHPARMCCWCLDRLGWIKPRTVRVGTHNEVLGPIEADRNQCVRVFPRGRAAGEYFLLEHRVKSGRDRAIPGTGLAIWHVDESRPDNDTAFRYRVGLEQADGKHHLEYGQNSGDDADLYADSGNRAFNATSVPSSATNSGVATGVSVAVSQARADGVPVRITVARR